MSEETEMTKPDVTSPSILTGQGVSSVATARPWSVVEATEHHGFYIVTEYGGTICDLYTMSRPWNASTLNGGDSEPVPFFKGQDGANAEFIVRACNSHDDLVAALEEIARISIGDAGAMKTHPTDDSVVQAVKAIARRALSLALGESK